jgi:hypothetical protein
MRTRDAVKLHPSVVQAADDVARAVKRRPYRNPEAAAELAGKILLQQQRIPREVLEAAWELAAGERGRIELCPWDDSAIVHNSIEQRQRWQKIHTRERNPS